MTVEYQHRAAEHARRRETEARRSIRISRARLAVFLVAMAGLIWIIARAPGVAWLAGDVALFDDGAAPTSDACTPHVGASIAGKIALIDRGTCTFVEKATFAEAAGASGSLAPCISIAA